MTNIQIASAAPIDGKRQLSGKETAQRAKAIACLRSPSSTECQGQVFVGLFFDGTGNNYQWAQPPFAETQRVRNKHSNVARLWSAHLDIPKSGFFRYYMPGVGTPFPEIGDTAQFLTENGGNGFGYKGADRINWGITSVINAVHVYLIGVPLIEKTEQRTLVNRMSTEMLRLPIISTEGTTRWSMLTGLEERLAAVVRNHQLKVKQINISIFGFSRGAAQARACAHWMYQIFESENGAFELAGIPVRIGFMGIFDTVASVGVGDVTPVTFGHAAWADGTQSVHPGIEDCVHFIALHEQRASFPLESATGRGDVGYPGMHSDVGGGYCPGEQGKSMPEWGTSPHLSQIPLLDMHFSALKGGVPMSTLEEINADPNLAKSFATDTKLVTAYNNWLATNGIKPADVTAFTQAHTNQYLRWRGQLHAAGQPRLVDKRFYKESKGQDIIDLAEADNELGLMLRAWEERQAANATFVGRVTERAKDVMQAVLPATRLFTDSGKDPLSAHEEQFLALMTKGATPPSASVTLFDDYVHDSRAGFRVAGHHEPEWFIGGYARHRHVFLQSDSTSHIYGWANESLKAVKAGIGATVEFFQGLYGFSTDTYLAARVKIYKTAHQVSDKGREIASDAKEGATAVGVEINKTAMTATNRVVSDANEAARVYSAAERKIVLRYVASQEYLRMQMKKRWESIK
jgi:hypothetical protein